MNIFEWFDCDEVWSDDEIIICLCITSLLSSESLGFYLLSSVLWEVMLLVHTTYIFIRWNELSLGIPFRKIVSTYFLELSNRVIPYSEKTYSNECSRWHSINGIYMQRDVYCMETIAKYTLAIQQANVYNLIQYACHKIHLSLYSGL